MVISYFRPGVEKLAFLAIRDKLQNMAVLLGWICVQQAHEAQLQPNRLIFRKKKQRIWGIAQFTCDSTAFLFNN